MNFEEILECVPNFSEGRDPAVIAALADEIAAVPRVRLLGIDSGFAVNRTVMSFAGPPKAVVEAAFRAMAVAKARIDMRKQSGAHPRIGSTDVCPFVPLRGLDLTAAAAYAEQLAERVGRELEIPVYLYAQAARQESRRELSQIRKGEYEGLALRSQDPSWSPDFGPSSFQPRSGATAIGARPLMLAYNVNLAGKNLELAREIAARIRFRGPIKHGKRIMGPFPGLKALGWQIDQQQVQVSMNLMEPFAVPLERLFQSIAAMAAAAGDKLMGSELVGLAPRAVLVRAGLDFLQREQELVCNRPSQDELIAIAASRLGLNAIKAFEPSKHVLENLLGEASDYLR